MFTHTDLDGVGCSILLKHFYRDHKNLDISYCNYNDINEIVLDFLDTVDNINEYQIFITDISVNENVANQLDIINSEYKNVCLLDHHVTAEWLNKYDWATVKEFMNKSQKTSGTQLLYNHFMMSETNPGLRVRKFVDIVRMYDTWEWKSEGVIIPKKLNDLLYIIGREEFEEYILKEVFSDIHNDIISQEKQAILNIEQRKIDKYVEKKNRELSDYTFMGYKAGVVFAENYKSELGNRLCELNDNLDFVVIVDMSSAVSYRSIGDKVHLGKRIASVYGGGGHMNAAGSEISDEIRRTVMEILFK